MRTEIFENYREFLQREDKTVNGVSQGFAHMHPDYEIGNKTNEGCWNCTNCTDCIDCFYCTDRRYGLGGNKVMNPLNEEGPRPHPQKLEKVINRSNDERIIDLVRDVLNNGVGKTETFNEHLLIKFMQIRKTPITSLEYDQTRVDHVYAIDCDETPRYPELKSRWEFLHNGLEVKVLMITNINSIDECDGVDIVFEVLGSGKPGLGHLCSMNLDSWHRKMLPIEAK